MDTYTRDGDSDPTFQAFLKEMEIKDRIKHRKAEEQSAVRRLQRLSKQGYLGLHTMQNPISESVAAVFPDISNLSLTGPAYEKGSGLPETDGFNPQRANTESWVLFISIDVEALEYNQRLITEIGVSTLATKTSCRYNPESEAATGSKKFDLTTSVSGSMATSRIKIMWKVALEILTSARADGFL